MDNFEINDLYSIYKHLNCSSILRKYLILRIENRSGRTEMLENFTQGTS